MAGELDSGPREHPAMRSHGLAGEIVRFNPTSEIDNGGAQI
jgi:hypothetical protein